MSFSAPVITGLAACLLEHDTTLSPQEIKTLIIRSSNFYPYPNNFLVNGVPSAKRSLMLLRGEEIAS
ncbi:MAG: S8 family serine peptidase [Cytophagales bacterium]|nr:S8 family serine peptidase [Cytophagales bacterium]